MRTLNLPILRETVKVLTLETAKLNRKTKPCDCCGLTVQEDRNEYQIAEQLEAATRKIALLIERYERQTRKPADLSQSQP